MISGYKNEGMAPVDFRPLGASPPGKDEARKAERLAKKLGFEHRTHRCGYCGRASCRNSDVCKRKKEEANAERDAMVREWRYK